jgi:hypothetical protein
VVGLSAAAAAAPTVAPVDDLRAGQTGYGLTVFSGSEPDTFDVTVLGVRAASRVDGDMILVELSGHGLERSAVARGMSGSPVYLDDGRLIGAVAFGWPGALRPIAGLTPAADLQAARTRQDAATDRGGHASGAAPRPAAVAAEALLGPVDAASLAARLLPAAAAAGGDPPGEPNAQAAPWPEPAALATRLLPVPSRGPAGAGDLAPLPMGIFAVPARGAGGGEAAAANPAAAPARLRPGSACAVALVSGDAQLGAMGTVSLVEGDDLVTMAHPFMQLGPVDLPLAAAEVVTIFPSREVSFKLGSAGPLVGRITHDLQAGLAGRLGAVAPTTDVRVTLAAPWGERTYRFAVARHPQLTPQLVFWCLYNGLLAEGDDRSQQLVTYAVDLTVREASGGALPPISLRGATGGPGGVEALTSDWQAPLQMLLTNRHRDLVVTEVDARLQVRRPLAAATITAIRAPALAVPGETVPVEVVLQTRRGGVRHERFELQVPAAASPGRLRLAAGSAREFFQFDAMRAAGLFEDHDLGTLLALLERPRARDQLSVALVAAEPGLTAGGREFAGLPPSVARVLADGPPGAVSATLARYAARAARDLDVLLQGSAVADLEIRIPPRPRPEGERP